MSRFNERYEEIILKDCLDPRYPRNRRLLRLVFGLIASVFFILYVNGFHAGLARNVRFVWNAYLASLTSPSSGFRTAVFIHNSVLLFAGFLGLVAVFLALALLAFDMQRRNEVIRRLLKRQNSATASEKKRT